MNEQRPNRITYEESCKVLQGLGYLEQGVVPPVPDHPPQDDDEEPLGVNFFRTLVGEGDLENLTLPRTYFARSEVGPVSFANTDLSESALCWNDFNKVNFTDADLSKSDLRASLFRGVIFAGSNLRDADLRRSTFEKCDFTDAEMRGAKLTSKQGQVIVISKKQREEIDWQESDGNEPGGG